jgi:flagellar biosynthesis/type III secretory pathway protein FliH
VAAEEVRARDVAAEIVAAARVEAEALVAEAKLAAATAVETAVSEAREQGEAKAAALYLRIKTEDERRAERDLDHTVSLAVLLAERLVGRALELEPRHVVALARQALAEARGARKATIDASPFDAEVLLGHLGDVGFEGAVVVRTDPAMTRGSLRISTNLGALDARLQPQLERLAAALREALEGAATPQRPRT